MTRSMQSVLIVGAGARGVACGHHLAAGGHRITFLVRPERAAALQVSFKLYSYDDHRLHAVSGYAVVAPVAPQGPAVDWVLLTLDGHALRSDPGIATRSAEHTSELQSLMRISYAVFCLKNK